MTHLILTPEERRAVDVMCCLCLHWTYADERKSLLDLLREVLPRVRRDLALAKVVEAASALLTAEGPAESSSATREAGRALVPQLRASIVASFAGVRPDLRKAG